MQSFLNSWQHLPENIHPVLISFGPIEIRYYGLMYFLAIVTTYALAHYRLKTEKLNFGDEDFLSDYFFWAIIGVLLGARLGYALFYNFSYFVSHPLEIFLPVTFDNGLQYTGISGLSYHGGVVGMVVSSYFFLRKRNVSFLRFADFIVPCVPLGYAFGRLGNFLNGELYGRVTQGPLGMYFPTAPTTELRHPSQLYELGLEGILLFCILWPLRNKALPSGTLLSLYIAGYGIVRFGVEFVREPDAHIGLLFLSLSMGQILCLSMIGIGAGLYLYALKTTSKRL